MHSSALFFLGLSTISPTGSVEADEIDFAWEAPAECPAEDEVATALWDLVHDAPRLEPAKVVAVARRQDDELWVLRLHVEGRYSSGDRIFEASTCTELAKTAALVGAIAFDPFGPFAMPSTEAPDSAQPVAYGYPPPVRAPRRRPRAATLQVRRPREDRPAALRKAPWAVRVGGGPVWSERAVPGGLARIDAERVFGRFALRFGPEAWYAGRFADADGTSAGVIVGRTMLHVRGCWIPAVRTLSFPLCVGAAAGAAVARGYGVASPRTRASISVALSGSLGLRWQPGRSNPGLSLFVDAEPYGLLTRPQFQLGNRTPTYEGSPLALALIAGLGLHFGAR